MRRPPGAAVPTSLVLVVAGALAVGALSFFLSKKSPSSGAPAKQATPVALAPAETFLWSDQPVVFSPPLAPFTRERHAEGGRKGVSFTRYAVPPTRITVAEAFLEPEPNTPEEAIAKLRLTKETFRSADSAEVGEPAPAAIGNAPGFQTDYTIRERSMEHQGREIVVLAGRRVFVFTFLGRPADVPVFDALVASATFPAPGGPRRAPCGRRAPTSSPRADGPPRRDGDPRRRAPRPRERAGRVGARRLRQRSRSSGAARCGSPSLTAASCRPARGPRTSRTNGSSSAPSGSSGTTSVGGRWRRGRASRPETATRSSWTRGTR